MTVDQMSLESFATLDTSTQKKTIYSLIRSQEGILSSRDIADITKIQRTSVTGRLRQLEDAGYIRKDGIKDDPVTGKRVNTYATEGEAWTF